MSTYSNAARFRWMFELPVTPFRHYQSPSVLFEHTDHLAYLHINSLYQKIGAKLAILLKRHLEMIKWQTQKNGRCVTLRGAPVTAMA